MASSALSTASNGNQRQEIPVGTGVRRALTPDSSSRPTGKGNLLGARRPIPSRYGVLHALRGGGPICGHREPSRPDASAQQRLASFPGGGAIEVLAHVDLPPGLRRDGDAIEIEDTTRSPGHGLPGGDDAGQVERIGTGQRHQFQGLGAAAHLAQESDRLGERELLPRGQGEEAPAAQLAARLAAAVDRDQLAPRRQLRLPRTEAPEHHPVAIQQHACRELGTALNFNASRAGLGAGPVPLSIGFFQTQ